MKQIKVIEGKGREAYVIGGNVKLVICGCIY